MKRKTGMKRRKKRHERRRQLADLNTAWRPPDRIGQTPEARGSVKTSRQSCRTKRAGASPSGKRARWQWPVASQQADAIACVTKRNRNDRVRRRGRDWDAFIAWVWKLISCQKKESRNRWGADREDRHKLSNGLKLLSNLVKKNDKYTRKRVGRRETGTEMHSYERKEESCTRTRLENRQKKTRRTKRWGVL